LDRAWRALEEAYGGLAEADLQEPGVTGAWSIRDIIAHVTTWEEEALKHLPTVLQGEQPPRYSATYGGIAAFNAQATERKKDLPLADVLRERDEVHQRLIAFLGTVPEEQLGGGARFRRRLRADTYGHYPKHAEAIRNWRKRRTTQA
jgi:hypothetical protein